MNSNEYGISLHAFRGSNIEKAFQQDNIEKAKVPKEHLKEMVKEHEQLVDVLDSPSHEDDKKESKKQNNLNKAFDILGLKSDFEHIVDIIKSDVAQAFGYGEGAESVRVSKKGSELKLMAQAKKSIYDAKYESLMSQKNDIKQQLCDKDIKFEQGEYGERVVYDHNNWDEDTQKLVNRFEDLSWQCRNVEKDCEVLKILIDNIQDNKSYNLTINQISTLQI